MPAYAGTVDWSGENPGMYLKESADGPFVTLVSFFRVVLSPHGRGHALVLLREPGTAGGKGNVVLSDNERLARWLVADYASSFGAFKGLPALSDLRYAPLTHVATSGDGSKTYVETVRGDGLEATLSWEGLGEAFALELPVEQSATGKHVMLSTFVGAKDGVATVNGERLKGHAVPREMAGRPITTAFLAFSETWIRA